MVNLFAFRSKNPKSLYSQDDPIGPENDKHIQSLSNEAGLTVAAWGIHGILKNRGHEVKNFLLTNPHYLELSKSGCPKHPLYLRADLKPVPF